MRASCLILTALVALSCDDKQPDNRPRTRIVEVVDGDTVKVVVGAKARKLRLYGVDCPEKDQAFGVAAKAFVSRYVGGLVRYEVIAHDRYGRTVARVFPQDCRGAKCREVDLNAELLEAGLAWWYKRYAPKATKYGQLEAAARKAKRGLWSGQKPIAPWTWRRMSRTARAEARRPRRVTKVGASKVADELGKKGLVNLRFLQRCTHDSDCKLWCCCQWHAVPRRKPVACFEDCPCPEPKPRAVCRNKGCALAAVGRYHGNTRSKVLHAPGCRHYDCTHCTARFSMAATAMKKGYRAHSCMP